MNHLPYDAFNGSLVEQDLVNIVGNDEPPVEAQDQEKEDPKMVASHSL